MTFAPFVLATALSMAGVLPLGKPAPESQIKMKNAVDGRSISIASVGSPSWRRIVTLTLSTP